MTTDQQLKLPRGVRIFEEKFRPKPFACQWRADGKRKTKFFLKEKHRDAFAESLSKGVAQIGIAAYQLNPSEAHDWRAFRAQLGEGTSLDDVLTCWRRHGKQTASSITVSAAVDQYLAAKDAEGISKGAASHYKSALGHLTAAMGSVSVSAVKREEVAEWMKSLSVAPSTRRTHFKRALGLFAWLHTNRLISESPCDGIKGPVLVSEEIETLTVEQGQTLFKANAKQPRELLGRLALEAFCGLRFSSASLVVPADVSFENRGINLPAAKIKTRRRQFIDGLPANVWAWLEWANVSEWCFTPRQYLAAKSAAMIRADVRVHNGLRHSFATYHVALHKDVSKTAVILCHSTPKTLWAHYKGRATEADGKAWFEIVPK